MVPVGDGVLRERIVGVMGVSRKKSQIENLRMTMMGSADDSAIGIAPCALVGSHYLHIKHHITLHIGSHHEHRRVKAKR